MFLKETLVQATITVIKKLFQKFIGKYVQQHDSSKKTADGDGVSEGGYIHRT